MEVATTTASQLDPVVWPSKGKLSAGWLADLTTKFDYASRKLNAEELPNVFPAAVAEGLIFAATRLLQAEPNIVDIRPNASQEEKVTLVGDVHGQYHDVLRLLDEAGHPGPTSYFVFNGDYVDRGAWGFETYMLLLAWKVYMPKRVILLRGNHETRYCASSYGFEAEVEFKYGKVAKSLLRKLMTCFAAHPLAATIAGAVYVAHGGLFRSTSTGSPSRLGKGKGKAKAKALLASLARGVMVSKDEPPGPLRLGNLQELGKVRRTILDPSGFGASTVPADVLWSDPSAEEGLFPNHQRGIGLLFGPDITQEFLSQHGLKLIVRSHEGPDAREKRANMQPMDEGFTIDHVVDAGQLITLFSAPDYPQFQGEERRKPNKAAFIVLRPPLYIEPHFFNFESAQPRPKAKAYYDYETAIDSDDELDIRSESSMGDLLCEVEGEPDCDAELACEIIEDDPPIALEEEPTNRAGLEGRRIVLSQ
eukprot:TRINITY_DN1644_c0_g2_i1.p1 TRINITY_DN1644_c0_g2~~TRINITY_DN1644_c0_g2_i1.p1  ORF type:complete len:477 (-),score=70.18 TRINITY_DN1644_c0_g2_i1:341-1771(-)